MHKTTLRRIVEAKDYGRKSIFGVPHTAYVGDPEEDFDLLRDRIPSVTMQVDATELLNDLFQSEAHTARVINFHLSENKKTVYGFSLSYRSLNDQHGVNIRSMEGGKYRVETEVIKLVRNETYDGKVWHSTNTISSGGETWVNFRYAKADFDKRLRSVLTK
jgi:hypothetical protein